MPVNRQQFNELLRPGLRRDFRDGYQEYEVEWKNVVRTSTMDRAEIDMMTISGLPQMVERNPGETFTMIDPQASPKITKTDTQYGLGFGVQKEVEEDDLYRKANQSSKWLGRSTRLTQEYAVADLLDGAFSTTTFTGYNGEALISSTHTPLVATATWSNQISGNPQLGVTSLQAAFELGEQTTDHQGDPIPVRIDYLIVNIANEWKAIQLTQNESEPFTADRNLNATRRKRQLSYTVNHYKDQTGKDWFARDSGNHDAHLAWKVKPQMIDWFEKPVLTAFYAARQRFLVYFYDQRGWIGSNAS
jgi:hypothetical protein